MLFRTIFPLLLLCVVALHAYGQFNDTIHYYTNFNSTGVVNRTNDGSSYVFNNGIKFNFYRQHFSINTNTNWIYGRQPERLTNNDFTSALDANIFKSQRHIYYWALASYDKSYSLKINYRVQSGFGVGYYVMDKKNFVVQISDGILYDKGDLYDNEASRNDYQIIRNSFRFKYRFIFKERIVLEGSDFLQHSLKDQHDYIIKSNTNLSLKMSKWLSFTTALTYNKLSLTRRENLLLNFGLTLERYF
jgi:hypothetical protein